MWMHVSLGDVIERVQNGSSCKQDKSGTGNKITRIETIADATINFGKTGFANLSEQEAQKARLEVGDILFSHINSAAHVGKTAVYRGEEPLWHGINLLRITPTAHVDSEYFNYFLKYLFWSGYWKKIAKQSVNQASVNQKDIKAAPFSYPPLTQQHRIVAKLDTAFAEINSALELAVRTQKSATDLRNLILADFLDRELDAAKQKCFDDCIEKIDVPFKLPKKNYLDQGMFPVVSQSAELVSGYHNNEEHVLRITRPLTVFGDHTQVLKYVDFDFVVGADGVKVLLPISEINAKYFYFVLQRLMPPSTGYARHYRLLRGLKIPVPPMNVQESIVERINQAFASIDKFKHLNVSKQKALESLKSKILMENLS